MYVINRLRNLKNLDNVEVTEQERQEAYKLYGQLALTKTGDESKKKGKSLSYCVTCSAYLLPFSANLLIVDYFASEFKFNNYNKKLYAIAHIDYNNCCFRKRRRRKAT